MIYDDERCQNTPNPICKDYKPPTAVNLYLTTPVDTPINIEAPSPANITKVSTSKNPKNGQLIIHTNNNTVTYTPNIGFVGFDDFSIEFCYTGPRCDTMNVEVEVKSIPSTDKSTVPTVPGKNEENETSTGLYALSALVLIPLIIASVFFVKRYRQKNRDSETMEPENPSPDVPPTSPSAYGEPSQDPSAAFETNALIGPEVSAYVSDDASRQSSSRGGASHSTGGVRKQQSPPGIESYVLSNKDQCRTHIGETSEIPVADALPLE
jgi:hypothetical protein